MSAFVISQKRTLIASVEKKLFGDFIAILCFESRCIPHRSFRVTAILVPEDNSSGSELLLTPRTAQSWKFEKLRNLWQTVHFRREHRPRCWRKSKRKPRHFLPFRSLLPLFLPIFTCLSLPQNSTFDFASSFICLLRIFLINLLTPPPLMHSSSLNSVSSSSEPSFLS